MNMNFHKQNPKVLLILQLMVLVENNVNNKNSVDWTIFKYSKN